MDNAKWHKSKKVKKPCTARWIQRIFNVAYSSDLNSIEIYFNQLKAIYKRKRLGLNKESKHFIPKEVIKASISLVDNEITKKICKTALRKWDCLTIKQALNLNE
jgi:hypothetical protein